MVIDADGLNCLRREVSMLSNAKAPVIVTPHPGEMARLLETADPGIGSGAEECRFEISRAFARSTGAYLVLKGVPTVIAGPEGRIFVNPTGNPGMATAGAGDVLTGIIAALLAQTGDPRTSCISGVYLHGLSGDIAADHQGEHAVIATDIIKYLPAAFRAVGGDGQADLPG
jgi:ADP-dependent NAD(P)H-hydrate dehydratase / NAD(P)H-hydrate epimerase